MSIDEELEEARNEDYITYYLFELYDASLEFDYLKYEIMATKITKLLENK